VSSADTHRAIDAVWRIESPRLIAGLVRMVRDVGVAEDLAQDALVAALEQWPQSGIPDNPGAWLMATAKHRAIDRFRRNTRLERKLDEFGRDLASKEMAVPDLVSALDDEVGDDLLRLVFISCHPVLSREAQVALTLRLLGGLSTGEIARAFLVPESTIAQRIVRAKRTLSEARVAFEVPRGSELAERLSPVLEVIYLVFNEGYSATSGDDWLRPALCEDALRLGRILAECVPEQAEVHGLVALMEIQASRSRARVGPGGEPILLLDQNRAQWDQLLIRRGLAALERVERLGTVPGPYAIQAAIAACHARALTPGDTDWPRIASLYAALAQLRHKIGTAVPVATYIYVCTHSDIHAAGDTHAGGRTRAGGHYVRRRRGSASTRRRIGAPACASRQRTGIELRRRCGCVSHRPRRCAGAISRYAIRVAGIRRSLP